MPRLLFTVLNLVFIFNALSQNALRDDLNGVYYDPTLYMQQYEVKDGSPYLDLAFQPAKIGNREKTYLVRFNAYKGNVEVWVKDNQVIILDTPGEQIKLLDGSMKEYVLHKYKDSKGNIKQGFLEVIVTSDYYTLYNKETIKYFKKTKAEGYAPAKPARFEKGQVQYYLKPFNSNMPIHLPNNKKRFLAIFGLKNADKAKMLMKKERLNLNKEADIIQLLNGIYGK